mgnify:FL=1
MQQAESEKNEIIRIAEQCARHIENLRRHEEEKRRKGLDNRGTRTDFHPAE